MAGHHRHHRHPRHRHRRRSWRRLFKRHQALLAAVAVGLSLVVGYLAAVGLGLVPEGLDYLSRKKLITGTSGKKYTIGETIDKEIKESRERLDQE